MTQRFDYSTLKPVRKTDEGFLHDTPIVGRIGIQQYMNVDGTVRRELRLPDEVFNVDSLASFVGKPITVDHPTVGRVTEKNVGGLSIGTILSAGKQDGETVVVDIVLHNPQAIGERRQLSLGYNVDLEETPGEWNGLKYDAIQRNIKVNHLSVVKAGRAGIARLNVDSDEILIEEKPIMPKIRMDNGIEYEAAAEVVAEVDSLRSKTAKLQLQLDGATPAYETLQAERDGLKAKLDAAPAELAKAIEKGRADALARLSLEKVAATFKIDFAGKTDREVKELVIKSNRKDADLTGKSDDYVNAAFDFANVSGANLDAAMTAQRLAANTGEKSATKTDAIDSKAAYTAYMDSLQNPKK